MLRGPVRRAGAGLIPRVLMSPWGDLLPDGLVVLRYTAAGGAVITLPVRAASCDACTLMVAVGRAHRKRWWRHFRRPAQVQVWWSGAWHTATGQVSDSPEVIQRYRQRFPRVRPNNSTVWVQVRFPRPSTEPALLHGRRLRRRWIAVVTAGEFAGFSVPATVAAVTAQAPAAVTLPAVLAAGAVEGAVLGASQAIVLRRAVRGIRPWWWIGATGAAAVVAYAIGMLPSTLGERLTQVPPMLTAGAAAALPTVLLASIGFAQWLVLRQVVRRSAWWITITAAAWTAGLGLFLAFTMPLWHPGQPLAATIVIGIVGGLLMAATTAAITGEGLRRLLARRPTGPPEHAGRSCTQTDRAAPYRNGDIDPAVTMPRHEDGRLPAEQVIELRG